MSKLILKPKECAYRFGTGCNYPNVYHPIISNKTCIESWKFPKDCPLQEGKSIPKSTEELIQTDRKNCISFIPCGSNWTLGKITKGRCDDLVRKKGIRFYPLINHLCGGTDCGCFEPKP